MSRRVVGLVVVLALVGRRRAMSVSVRAQTTGIREVTASARSLIPLQTRLRYTTMIVLPDGEEILDVICGDQDFWVISADAEHRAREAGEGGAATNLNLVTASGDGLLVPADREERRVEPDLKVYVNADPNAPTGQAEVLQRRPGRAACRRELDRGASAASKPRTGARRKRSRRFQQQYPTQLQFVVRPAEVREAVPRPAIWHDGQFTYIKSDATELPALYEVKDGKPALVNFQVQQGTYVVPKVLDAAIWRSARSASRSRSRSGEPWPTRRLSHRRQRRQSLHRRHRPSPVAARRAAARRADLADGRPRRVHAADHVRGRPAGGARPTGAAPAAPPCAPSADRVRDYQDRLRALEAQSAGAAGRATDRAGRRPARCTTSRPRRRQRTRSTRSGGGASTRACSPATSC